jgi:hypothetical protein
VLQIVQDMFDQSTTQGKELTAQVIQMQHDLQKSMRRFGRQCRGQGHVFVKLVRETASQLLHLGQHVGSLALSAQRVLQNATRFSTRQHTRLAIQLTTALEAHQRIAHQSQRLTHGKTLSACKIVNPYDRTLAPIGKGKSNCPTQFGRKPGMIAEPASGCIFAAHLPVGNPGDKS